MMDAMGKSLRNSHFVAVAVGDKNTKSGRWRWEVGKGNVQNRQNSTKGGKT